MEVFSYLKRLKDAGLAHVYLQFDGFDDEVYKALRNKSLIKNKLAVLENLKKLKIPTTFNVTLAKGVNEHQIRKIIDYSIENSDFVRQIGFLPLIRVGGADNYREEIVPECHEFLKIIERKTKGRINLNNLRAFQKLMYVVYRFTKFRRCFWFTLFILVKEKNGKGYRTIDELIDMKAAESAVDEYIKTLKLKNKPSLFANLKLLFKLIVHILNFNTLPLCFSGLKFLLFGRRLEDARSDRGLIFITCTDFCDLYKMDLDMADNFCEELLAVKDKTGNIVYKPTYRMMIEGSKDN